MKRKWKNDVDLNCTALKFPILRKKKKKDCTLEYIRVDYLQTWLQGLYLILLKSEPYSTSLVLFIKTVATDLNKQKQKNINTKYFLNFFITSLMFKSAVPCV